MMIQLNKQDAVRMAVGAIILSLVFISVYHLYHKQNPAEQLASKASRIDIVSRMRIALASASEAEKSAVLAVTDGESRTFAEQARAAAAEVEKGRRELEQRLETGGTQTERDLFGQFSEFFLELQRIDRELLDLAVRNTNVKAYHLAFGPAASALDEMNAVLSRLVSSNAGSPEEKQVMSLAYGAEIAGLRIQTLLFPHIAEESGRRMDEMEALMSKEDGQIRRNLADLAAFPQMKGKTDLANAAACYTRFGKIRSRILALSRENTNVRSLSLSLSQKRKAMLVCQEALDNLQQAILSEPIAGVTYGRTPRPR